MNRTTGAAWVLAGLLTAGTGQAVPMVEIVPSSPVVTVGDLTSVEVVVSGLVDEYVGTYDLTLEWDPALLGLQGVAFDVFLDGPADSLTDFISGSGTVNVFEVSFGSLLNQTGSGTFRLFSLTFNALAAGVSSLGFSSGPTQLLGDANGEAFSIVDLSAARISIEPRSTAVPEPGTLVLMLTGLAGLGLSRRRKAN